MAFIDWIRRTISDRRMTRRGIPSMAEVYAAQGKRF